MDWLSVFWFSLVLISLGAAAYFTERHEAKKREEERGEREERRRLAPEEGPSPLPCYEYGSIGGRPIYYKGLAITFTRPPPHLCHRGSLPDRACFHWTRGVQRGGECGVRH